MAEWITGNRFLSLSEMENNAQLVANELAKHKWTKQAIAGALGNMQTESTINPGIWQDLTVGGGYGLVQWTPYTKYSEWAGDGWEDNGSKECERIQYEVEHSLQWITTDEYPMSFEEYIHSTESADYLAWVWLYNYERPTNLNQPDRAEHALYWFDFIRAAPPIWLLWKMKENNERRWLL